LHLVPEDSREAEAAIPQTRGKVYIGTSGYDYRHWRGAFRPDRVEAFLSLLPPDSAAAERLARRHDRRVSGRALLRSPEPVRYRHAFEVRHPSFLDPAFYELLRTRDAAFVIADSAGKFVRADEVTATFVSARSCPLSLASAPPAARPTRRARGRDG
jgi:uncharacterized protein YecE (DUF72 family)